MAAESGVDEDEKYLYGDGESNDKENDIEEDSLSTKSTERLSELRADAPEFTSKITALKDASITPKADADHLDDNPGLNNHELSNDSNHSHNNILSNNIEKQDENGEDFAEGEEDDDEDDDDDDDDDIQVTIGEISQVGSTYRDPVAWKANQTNTQSAPAAPSSSSKGVDVNAVGQVNDTPIYEYDFDTGTSSIEEKPWRKPGADISDYFNYGFTEDTWKQYCEKQRRLRSEGGQPVMLKKVQSATPAASGTPQAELEVLPDGRTRFKAGPPPDRQAEGSIAVIGGESARLENRRREEEEMMMQSMRPPPGFNPMFPPGMPRPMYRQMHPNLPPPFFAHQPPPMEQGMSMSNPAMSTASSMPNSHGIPVRPSFADPMAGMFPHGIPGQLPSRGMPGAGVVPMPGEYPGGPPLGELPHGGAADPYLQGGAFTPGLPIELGTFREQFPSPERESDYDSESHDGRPSRRRRDKDVRHRETKDRDRETSRDRDRDRERDRDRDRDRRHRDKDRERDKERSRTKEKSRTRRSEHSKERKVDSGSGSSSRKKHSRSSSKAEEGGEDSDQPKKKSRKSKSSDDTKSSKDTSESKAE